MDLETQITTHVLARNSALIRIGENSRYERWIQSILYASAMTYLHPDEIQKIVKNSEACEHVIP